MSVRLITLSNHLYEDSRKRLCKSATVYGIINVIGYNFEDIKSSVFYAENEKILANKKFMGYWLWKPYIILKTLKEMSENDILIYADAGMEIISKLDDLIDLCADKEPVMLFGNAADLNVSWTKRDCFVLMDCDNENFWYSPHCDASFSLFRKCDFSIDFLENWLKFCCNEDILTDKPNSCGLPNLPEYIDHRYDQSVLSLLAQKYKLTLYRIPSQFGNHFKMHKLRIKNEFNCINQYNQKEVNYYSVIPYYNSYYGQLVNHHRTKNKVNNDIDDDIISSNMRYNSIKSIFKFFSKS